MENLGASISKVNERNGTNADEVIPKKVDFFLNLSMPNSKRHWRPPSNSNGLRPRKNSIFNGFFFFMKERRPTLEAEGKNFPGGWREVAEFMESDWESLSQDERDKYRVMSKKDPQTIPWELRRTHFGRMFHDIRADELKKRQEEERISQIITDVIGRSHPRNINIILINFSIYLSSERNSVYIPGEVGLSVFNIKDGLKDNYSSLIDPGCTTSGYGLLINNRASRCGVPSPPYSNAFQQYSFIVDKLEEFVNQNTNYYQENMIVFCQRHEIKPFKGCLEWLYDQCDERSCPIQLFPIGQMVRRLSYLGVAERSIKTGLPMALVMAKLVNKDLTNPAMIDFAAQASASSSGYSSEPDSGDESAVCSMEETEAFKTAWSEIDPTKDKVFFHESEVDEFLENSNLSYDYQIACIHHMNPEIDGVNLCPLNIVNRRAYLILGALVKNFCIQPLIGYHFVNHLFENMESDRTKEMLKKWDPNLDEKLKFHFDGKIPANYSCRILNKLKSGYRAG